MSARGRTPTADDLNRSWFDGAAAELPPVPARPLAPRPAPPPVVVQAVEPTPEPEPRHPKREVVVPPRWRKQRKVPTSRNVRTERMSKLESGVSYWLWLGPGQSTGPHTSEELVAWARHLSPRSSG